MPVLFLRTNYVTILHIYGAGHLVTAYLSVFGMQRLVLKYSQHFEDTPKVAFFFDGAYIMPDSMYGRHHSASGNPQKSVVIIARQ
jgi:hypothetical protein